MADRLTKRWIKNASDERAVRNGCRFDEARGQFVIDWAQRYCYLYEGELAGKRVELMDWQQEFFLRLFGWVVKSKDWGREVRRFRKASLFLPKKNGKALALDTPVPTPSGWTTIGKLRPGDELFSETGEVCCVIKTHSVITDDETYRLTFSNGEQVVCNGEHLWKTTALQRSVNGCRQKVFAGNKWVGSLGRKFKRTDIRTTQEIVDSLRRGDGACNHSIELQGPLQLPDRELPIDPYVLGCWLGDGDSDCARITCDGGDFETYRNEFASCGYDIAHTSTNSNGAVRFRFQRRVGETAERTILKRLELFKNKHIPAEYLRASIAQRLSLLQGLMDTDGFASKDGKCIAYCTKLEALAAGVRELLSSLGVKHKTKVNRRVISWRERSYHWIQFHAFRDVLPVFRLQRKLERMRESSCVTMKPRSTTVQITDAERIAPTPVRCITVDNPTGLFLCGRTMLPTHNSPTAAMVGLYLLIADGEQGQKVFSAAKDGKQAGIVHTHARMMVEMSPELSRECKINRSTGRIAHVPTRSYYDILAGDNIAGQEGLNGSVIIDETHVVDSRLASVLEYMGASRSEPIQLEVSTAGNNPEGYGKRQWDYGRQVEQGEIPDDAFLFVDYSAAQDATDEQCGQVEVWRKANPSWGVTIKEGEFKSSYERAKKSLSDFANFKMYRLNIWQKSSNPWIRQSDWANCRKQFDESDLYGMGCFAGLDLSRTRDMSSLVLVFPMDEERFRVLPYYWLPKNFAVQNSHLAPYVQWSHDRKLRLIEGDTIDQRVIFKDIEELSEKFVIQRVAYDRTFAEEITARMEEELGIERVVFKQNMLEYAGPTADFERLVISGGLEHNGHPVYSWQAGHVEIKTDHNSNNRRPVKPKNGLHRTVDGIQATVMGLSMAIIGAPEKSIYEAEGALGLY